MQLAVVDVHYLGDGARAALVLIADWASSDVLDARTAWLDEVPAYRPGRFFERELPPLLAVLDGAPPLTAVVVDGYVDLDGAGRPGLGRHLYEALAGLGDSRGDRRVPVVGIAKTAFRGADHARAVHRGAAVKPLYVTSAGIPLDDAADQVRRMAGHYRVPDAVRLVDRIARSGDPSLATTTSAVTGPVEWWVRRPGAAPDEDEVDTPDR